jgi:hypothetical protein
MSAAIAGPASIAASPTLPSKNFFIAEPPKVPHHTSGIVSTGDVTLACLEADGCDICATVWRIRS